MIFAEELTEQERKALIEKLDRLLASPVEQDGQNEE